MNRTKLILPLAALLMMPVMTSCGGREYQGVFNDDQIICTHGAQVINVTLDSHVKSKLHFKDELTREMFKMPEDEKYANKNIESAFSYNNGSSAYILIDGDILNQSESSSKLEITVTKDAFKEDSLGGTISLTLYRNQIRYGDYMHSWVNIQGYYLDAVIEMIGATPLCPEENYLNDTEYFEVGDNDEKISSGLVRLYKIDGQKYFLSVFANAPQSEDLNGFYVTFKNTSLPSSYSCTIKTSETGPFYFL